LADEQLRAFNLVGGTALALQLGHRKSVDLDLFTTSRFDTERMAEYLEKQYKAEIFDQNDKGAFGYIGQVKFDVMREPHPLIDKPEIIEGLRMLSIRDIGAMKMNAVYEDGGRIKDFADIYKLLEKNSLNAYLDYTRRKYPEFDPAMFKRLLYSNPKVDLDGRVKYMGNPVEWNAMVKRFGEAFQNPGKTFGEVAQLKNEQRFRKTLRQRKGHRPG
jgi:hypothetical protein